MFASKSGASFVITVIALSFTHCTMTEDKEDVSTIGTPDSRDPIPDVVRDVPKAPGQGGGDSTKVPQAGQLTAGEIDDHLNYPKFKAYVQKYLNNAQQSNLKYSLPDESDVKDRFAGATPAKALDLAFAIDATGSMGDEMNYLAKEFQSIVGRIQSRHPDLSIRYGLVFYRDHGDDFVVKSHGFRSSVEETQNILKVNKAGGGGDTPEAMDEALVTANALDWRGSQAATQMLFLVADAPPHDNKVAAYMKAVENSVSKGIRIYPLAASSTDELTELLMRISAFQSSGTYSFLTDDSGIGNSHKEPRIPCYVVTRLDALLTRLIESEIAGARIEPDPATILRQSGNYQKGHCQETQTQTSAAP